LDNRQNFDYAVSPGGFVKDQVAVLNLGTDPITLDLASADATTGADGSFSLSPPNEVPTLVGQWVKVDSPGKITIPGRTAKGPSYKIVNFSVSVPTNASPGDHAGGITVALTAKGTGSGVSENLVQRVGYRVYVRVSGAVHPNLSIQNLTATYNGGAFANPLSGSGSVTVKYRVYNSGNATLGAKQTIAVKPTRGSAQTVVSATQSVSTPKGALLDVPLLLPGSFIDVTQVIKGVTPGYKVNIKVTLTPVVPLGQSDPSAGPFTASTSIWAITWLPVTAIGVLLLLGLGFGLWRWRLRRRTKAPLSRHGSKSEKGSKAKKKSQTEKLEKTTVGGQGESGSDVDSE
jgi:hypothetical protein